MLRQLLLVTVGLAVCFMGTAEAGRRRRRRRRSRRNKAPATSTPCGSCGDDNQVAATGSFKGGKTKKGKLSAGEGACDCADLCGDALYYQVQQKKSGDQICYCAAGRLKKMKASKKAFLGAVTVELSATLVEMAEKHSVAPNTACTAEAPATPNPTQSPTPSPTPSPSADPTQSPTQSPTPSPSKDPTQNPTQNPTQMPTESPTESPVVPERIADGEYLIVQLSTDRYLDAFDDGSNDYSVVTRDWQGNDSQVWTVTNLGGNAITLVQKSSNRYLDAHENANDNSAVTRPAQTGGDGGVHPSQQWRVTPAANAGYRLVQVSTESVNVARSLDAYGTEGQIKAGNTNAVTRAPQDDGTQDWIFLAPYVEGTEGENLCPSGSRPILTEAACWKAAAWLNIVARDGSRTWSGPNPVLPSFCSYQSGTGGDNAPHWNTHVGGENDGGYTPICSNAVIQDEVLVNILAGTSVSAAALWTGTAPAADGNTRSAQMDDWNNIKADYPYIRVSIREDAGNLEAAQLTFSTIGKDRDNWFSRDNVVSSSFNLEGFTTVDAGVGRFFQLEEQCCGREFLISNNYGGCDKDAGWLNLDAASKWERASWSSSYDGREYSEENGGWGHSSAKPMVGGWCGGSNCDNHKNRYTDDLGDWNSAGRGNYGKQISDEGYPNNWYSCPADEIISEIRCTGGYCDNMQIYCSGPITTIEYRLVNGEVNWGPWFSEENGGRGYCPKDRVVKGAQCKGGNCDDIRWRCAPFEKDIKTDPCPWEHDDWTKSWKNDAHTFQIFYSISGDSENFLTGNVGQAHSVQIIATARPN